MAKKKNKNATVSVQGKDGLVAQKTEANTEDSAAAQPAAPPVNHVSIAALTKTKVELPHGVTGIAWEPVGTHTGSVILLHGLGDASAYWEPFHAALLRSCKSAPSLRWVVLDAPERRVWKERMSAWFQYRGPERSGQNVEDDINEAHLVEMRETIHPFIEKEAEKLRGQGGINRVVLVGSSQGGSMALDLALGLPTGMLGRNQLAGVAMLRALALGATAEAAAVRAQTKGLLSSLASALAVTGSLPVLAVSGEKDDTFILSLVQQQLKAIEPFVVLSHEVLSGLDHDATYDSREIALTVQFIAERLQLQSQDVSDVDALAKTLQDSVGSSVVKARDKSWADLNDDERKLAKKLGVNGPNAWDNGTAPVWCQYWRKLTPQQRQAAEQLSYDEELWDAG